MKNQPKALYLLNFISMWECFSYYGMRVLLVLYMISELQFNDYRAFGLYALYTMLIEFGGILGGLIADKFLGLKQAIRIGAITILLGHVCLSSSFSPFCFYLGLGTIIAGTQLFRSNIPALLGEFYKENDPLKTEGYTLYYTGINLGGFLASICCGFIAEYYGWHAGFGIAAVGMALGVVALYAGETLLSLKKEKQPPKKIGAPLGYLGAFSAAICVSFALYYHEVVSLYIPFLILGVLAFLYKKIHALEKKEKKPLLLLCGYLVFLILFYACEEQLGSSLLLFAERHVERITFLGVIPSTSLITFNPLTILLVAPFLGKMASKMNLKVETKLSIGFSLLALSFFTLFGATLFYGPLEKVALLYPVLCIIFMACGEVFIGPTLYTMASNASSASSQGFAMGLVALGYALANFLSGEISQKMAVTEETFSFSLYQEGFGFIALASLLVAIFLVGLKYNKKVSL